MLARAASDNPPAGVTTFSAGNAAAATAYAARILGIPATVCMPPGAVEAKVEAVKRYGGEIVFTDDLVGTAVDKILACIRSTIRTSSPVRARSALS